MDGNKGNIPKCLEKHHAQSCQVVVVVLVVIIALELKVNEQEHAAKAKVCEELDGRGKEYFDVHEVVSILIQVSWEPSKNHKHQSLTPKQKRYVHQHAFYHQ